MTAQHTIMEEPDWEDAFNDPAVRAVSRMVPKNDAEEHTSHDDSRILENMRRQAPWLRGIISRAMAEVDAQ